MEKKSERKWKTLRTLTSQEAVVEEEAVSVAGPDSDGVVDETSVQEEPIQEEPLLEEPVEIAEEDTTKIRVSAAPKKELPEPSLPINEDRDWIAPESHDPAEAVVEFEEPEGDVLKVEAPQVDPAVFEELERPDSFFATAISMGPEPVLESNEEAVELGNRILVAHGVTSTSRLIRETLENFTEAEVVTTSDPVRAFELALQKPFRRFFFAMQVGELSGAMLYELISKAYANGRATRTLAPGVVFIREKSDPPLASELARDARVKDSLSKPIRIERLLKSVEDIFEVRDPTVK